MSIGKGKLSRGAFSGRVRDLVWIVWWARGGKVFWGEKGGGMGECREWCSGGRQTWLNK